MKITLQWNKALQFFAMDETGHKVIVDIDREHGGLDEGMTPLRFLLVALAGCMAMDIVTIVQKKGGKIKEYSMELEGIRADDHPRRFVKIINTIRCVGEYKREDLERAFELSRDKYCSALGTIMIPPEFVYNIV